jgi:energy-coupling factor transporter ATP-binding protein EcfA2
LLRPSSGRIRVDRLDGTTAPTSTLSRSVGYVFQNPDNQIFCPSVREELEFGVRRMGRVSEKEIVNRVQSALAFVGLEEYAERHPFTLSKGERQKLAVASVVAVEPKVLVIDEPSTGLDAEGTERMMQLIHRLHDRGHTIIIITHDMQLVAEHAQRVIVISDGRVVADAVPRDVFLDPQVLAEASLTPPPMAALSIALRAAGVDITCVGLTETEQVLASMMHGVEQSAH